MTTMSVDKSSELTDVFNPQEKGVARTREISNNAAKKNQFLNELILIVSKDQEGKIIDGCEWKITRRKLSTLKVLADLIKHSPTPELEIDYLCDESGAAYWPEELFLQARPIPASYCVIPKVKRQPYDIQTEPKYEGQHAFVITRVPLKVKHKLIKFTLNRNTQAKDELTVVDVTALREWLMCAIIEEDPYSRPFYKDIEDTKDVLKQIARNLKMVSKMEFRNANGDEMPVERAEQERELLYKAYGEERANAEKRLKIKEHNLNVHVCWRKRIGMDFIFGEVDENTETASWFVKIYGSKDAKEMEDLLIKKMDWAGIHLACGRAKGDPRLPPWAGRGPCPDGTKPHLPDYSELQVNVAGARFARVPHGVGTYRTMDRLSSSYYTGRFGMFYGNWEAGRKHGHGIEFNDVGVYCGRFVEGNRNGHAQLDLADGTTITGNFNVVEQLPDRPTGVFENPYRDGEPQGKVNILFGDGAMYRGSVIDGKINGQGEYQSAFGELYIGNFENGILHGPNGFVKNAAGDMLRGNWAQGELQGLGFYQNRRGDTYDGYWEGGLRHGRGTAKFKNRGYYRGYYMYNAKYGKGELAFGRMPKPKKKSKKVVDVDDEDANSKTKTTADDTASKESKKINSNLSSDEAAGLPEPEFKFLYQGFFLSNSVTNGGIMMNMVSMIPVVLSRRDNRSLMPVLALMRKEEKLLQRARRKLDKYHDMEHHIRGEMCHKKIRVFRQQRHFTKKSMHAHDTYGELDKSMLKTRYKVRKDRLDNINPTQLAATNALVPHLKDIDTSIADHLSSVCSLIKPDKDFGKVSADSRLMAQIAVSDFEEAKERQRFLKYDRIWARAEKAFIDHKKGSH